GQSALGRAPVGNAAVASYDPDRGLAEPQGVRHLRKFRLRPAIPRRRGAIAWLPLRRSPLCADQLITDLSGEHAQEKCPGERSCVSRTSHAFLSAAQPWSQPL